ncbi:AIG2 family protein [Klebsiella pneumoniae]|uniref:AIG2 family protein n=1 Tax=Klebsiella pneumoniae TaxID=573 RepID=A0A2X3EEM0_KLEPN|nr:AIG2 family protein [Klebsiella pneumoniae]
MKPLFVYGTLCPGRSNAHILEAIGGEWRPGYVTGTFYARAGAQPPISRGSSSTLTAHGSTAICSCPIGWRRTGPCWTTLRRGTIGCRVEVTTDDGQQISAWIYQLQPRG